MQLRLTRRALADLGLNVEAFAGESAEELRTRYPLIKAFVDRRKQSPTGQEAIQLPVTRAPVFSLHSGRWRGLTWHDEEPDVVWLLGAGYHRSGDRTDAYAELKQRDSRGELFPTEQDYLDLEPDPRPFVESVAEQAPALLAKARAAPSQEVRDVLADALEVGVVVNVVEVERISVEETWVAFAMPPKAEGVLPPDWLMATLAALLPEARESDLDFGVAFPRPGGSRPNEIVICWRP